MGGSLNAFTGKEFTCLHGRALHEQMPLIMELLGDIFLRSNLPEEEIERERQVILQEINMVDDSPEELIHELFAGAYWRGHPLGQVDPGDQRDHRSIWIGRA